MTKRVATPPNMSELYGNPKHMVRVSHEWLPTSPTRESAQPWPDGSVTNKQEPFRQSYFFANHIGFTQSRLTGRRHLRGQAGKLRPTP